MHGNNFRLTITLLMLFKDVRNKQKVMVVGELTMLLQRIRVWSSRSNIMILLTRVFLLVVTLQRTSNVTGIMAVGTTKWLQ